MKTVAIIPARYASSQFSIKSLADICGKPMIWWVYQQVKKVSEFSGEVYIATDDARIEKVCNELGMNVIMTDKNIQTSTDRVFYVANKLPRDIDVYVCVNGDEPLIQPETIRAVLPQSKDVFFANNLMTKINSAVEAIDNTNIKVVTDYQQNALFMSRNPIPYPKSYEKFDYYKHIGVLAYCYDALKFFSGTEMNKNEKIEDINELRFIENGKKLNMITVETQTLSVDAPKDLDFVRTVISKKVASGELSNE